MIFKQSFQRTQYEKVTYQVCLIQFKTTTLYKWLHYFHQADFPVWISCLS
jgi:hypothetical protein